MVAFTFVQRLKMGESRGKSRGVGGEEGAGEEGGQ